MITVLKQLIRRTVPYLLFSADSYLNRVIWRVGVVLLIAVILINPVTALAAINQQINYQGKLTDSSDAVVSDGNYSIVFSLYTASTGGTAVWTETKTVSVDNGLFSVMLGADTALSSVNFNQTLYLGVKVGSDAEMTPRKTIGAVPAAFEADKLDGMNSTDFIAASTTTLPNIWSLTGLGQYGSSSATTTAMGNLAVIGTTIFNGLVSGYQQISAPFFTATSTSQASTFPYASSTALTATIGFFNNILATASTTLQNFTGVNSTTTNATTTTLAITSLGQGWLYQTNTGVGVTSSTSPTVNYLTATSTTATSTFYGNVHIIGNLQTSASSTASGQATFTYVPIIPHSFGSWAIDTANSNVNNSTVYINPATAATDTNLLGLAVGGGVKFLVDAEGDIFANSLTLVGSQTVSTSSISTLIVENNSYLGDAANSDWTHIKGSAWVESNKSSGASSTALTVTQTGTGNIFRVASDYSTANPFFLITAAGNVGIATSSPYAPLSVFGQTVSSYFTATTSQASTFPYASTTMITSSLASTTNLLVSRVGTSTQAFAVGSGTINNIDMLGGDLYVGGDGEIDGVLYVQGQLISSGETTFTGGTTFTNVPTLAHSFSSWAIGTANSNVDDATIYINPATAASDTNLFGAAVNGSVKFLLDADGDVFANSITTIGGSTLSTSTISTLIVENSSYLGDATSNDWTHIKGSAWVESARSSGASTTAVTITQTGTGDFFRIAADYASAVAKFVVKNSGLIGVGTSTPWGLFSINADALTAGTPQFVVGSSTATNFIVDNSGDIGIASTSPFARVGIFSNSTSRNTLRVHQSTSSNTQPALHVIAAGSSIEGYAANTGGEVAIFQRNFNSAYGAQVAIVGGTAGSSQIIFGDKDDIDIGRVMYDHTNNSLDFYTNAAEVASFNSSGYLGVGSTTPWGLLSVNANGLASGAPQFVVGSSTATNLIVANSGYVGIGAVSPAAPLHLVGANYSTSFPGNVILQDTTAYNGTTPGGGLLLGGKFNVAGDLTTFSGLQGIKENTTDANSAGALRLLTRVSGASALTEGMRVTSAGNVGIGTTTPQSLINSTASKVLALSTQSGFPAFTINNVLQEFSMALSSGLFIDIAGDATAANNFFAWRTSQSASSVSVTEQMRLTSNGLLGVGTSTPFATLAVNPKAGYASNQFVVGSSTATNFLINNTGNVGINNRAPNQKLDVNGIIQAYNGDGLADPTAGASAGARYSLNSGTSASQFFGMGIGAVDGGAYPIWFQTGATNGGGFEWYDGTTERMRIDVSGNVGIGTTSPFATLSVNPVAGAASNQFVVGSSTATNFIVTNSGNVGIGTAMPSSKLDVIGDASLYSTIGSADNVRTGLAHYDTTAMGTGVGGQLVLGYKYLGETYTAGGIIKTYKENATNGQYGSGLKFQVRNHGENLATQLTIDPSGNLGIGTTTPGSILSIGNTGNDTINIFATATSTFGSGINLRTGCFSINNTCVGPGSGGSGTVSSGVINSLSYYPSTGTTVDDATGLLWISSTSRLGIATTTATASLEANHINLSASYSTTPLTLRLSQGGDASGANNGGAAGTLYLAEGGIAGSSGNRNGGAGGTLYIARGGVANEDGTGGAGGRVILVSGGALDNVGTGSYGSDGRVDIGNPDTNGTGAVLNVYGNATTTGNLFVLGTYINSVAGYAGKATSLDTSISLADNGISTSKNGGTGGSVSLGLGGSGFDNNAPGTGGTGGTLHFATGGTGGAVDTSGTSGTGGTGGTVNIGAGGTGGNGDSGTAGDGGAGGTLNLVLGGVTGSGGTPGSYGSDGTVNIGNSAGQKNAALNVYGRVFIETFTAPGNTPLCYDGTSGSYIGACSSLAQYKNNVQDLSLNLETIMQLKPREFDWIDSMGGEHDLGFVAEEVIAIAPVLGEYHDSKLAGVKYRQMVALAIKGIQEQQLQIASTTAKLDELIAAGTVGGYWTLNAETNEIQAFATLDLNNFEMRNVKAITSASGKWSIDENGKLLTQDIETKRLLVEEGVTTRDKSSGDYYCIYVEKGNVKTDKGRCEDLNNDEEENNNPEPEVTPDPESPAEEPAPESEEPEPELVPSTAGPEPEVTPEPEVEIEPEPEPVVEEEVTAEPELAPPTAGPEPEPEPESTPEESPAV